jgi:hypothetical protein
MLTDGELAQFRAYTLDTPGPHSSEGFAAFQRKHPVEGAFDSAHDDPSVGMVFEILERERSRSTKGDINMRRNDLADELAHRRHAFDSGHLGANLSVAEGQQGQLSERGQWEAARGRTGYDDGDPNSPLQSMQPAAPGNSGMVPFSQDDNDQPPATLQNNREGSKGLSNWSGSNRPAPSRAPLNNSSALNREPDDNGNIEAELHEMLQALAERAAARRRQVQGTASMDQEPKGAASPRELQLRGYLSGFPDKLSEDDIDHALELYRKEVGRDAPIQSMTSNTPFTRFAGASDHRPSGDGGFSKRFPEAARLRPMDPSDQVR